jgi:hypothetical protein
MVGLLAADHGICQTAKLLTLQLTEPNARARLNRDLAEGAVLPQKPGRDGLSRH